MCCPFKGERSHFCRWLCSRQRENRGVTFCVLLNCLNTNLKHRPQDQVLDGGPCQCWTGDHVTCLVEEQGGKWVPPGRGHTVWHSPLLCHAESCRWHDYMQGMGSGYIWFEATRARIMKALEKVAIVQKIFVCFAFRHCLYYAVQDGMERSACMFPECQDYRCVPLCMAMSWNIYICTLNVCVSFGSGTGAVVKGPLVGHQPNV